MKFILRLSTSMLTLGLSAVLAKDPLTIAVIPKGTTHEFWKSVHAGANKAGQEFGVKILWKGPLREDDREDQIKVVEEMTTAAVAGIVLAPLDDSALRAPVMNATRSGIPVVVIDSDLKSKDFISFVATDNFAGGKLAGEHLIRLLNGKGKVVMLRYAEGSASTANREKGFLDAVTEFNAKHAKPAIEVVSSNQYGGATTESAYKASENLLAPFKSEGALAIQGIFCCNESTTFGMLRALQDGGLSGKVRFVGFDASPKLVEALQKGQIDALTIQNPMRMGYLGVKTLVEHLQKKKVEMRIDTGVTLVTRERLTQPEVSELLNPDLEKWLNESGEK